jgi:ABC-type multidrug transport system ATPase subunit
MLSGEIESDDPKVDIYFHGDSKVFVYDQTHKAVDDSVVILEQLTTFVSDERAKMLLSLVDIPKQHWLAYPDVLSGGERARLGLAKLIASEANLLLLDEPTNDLDIGLIERLEDALRSSDSAAIFVTHDERFVENVATRIWSLEHGKLVEYQGGIAGYFKKIQKIEALNVESNELNVEETDEEKMERLELERLELDNILLDSLAHSERDYARAKLRLTEVTDELSVLYDKPLPQPRPRYQLSEQGVEVSANVVNGQVELMTNVLVTLKLLRRDGVAHFTILESEETCLLLWARVSLLNLMTRLAFLYFDARVVQYQSEQDVSGSLLKNAGSGWWVLERSSFEAGEKFVRQRGDKKRRRKKHKRTRPSHQAQP